jgi:hypothetical protein
MKKNKKHAAPLLCRLFVRLRKPTWQGFSICDIGAGGCRRCEGCEHYKPDKVRYSIIEAADRLSEKCHELAETLKDTKLTFNVRLPQVYKIAEDEPEEESQPWPKKNPYINKTKED